MKHKTEAQVNCQLIKLNTFLSLSNFSFGEQDGLVDKATTEVNNYYYDPTCGAYLWSKSSEVRNTDVKVLLHCFKLVMSF